MKQSAYRNAPLCQIVVQPGCLARFQYVALHTIHVQPLASEGYNDATKAAQSRSVGRPPAKVPGMWVAFPHYRSL